MQPEILVLLEDLVIQPINLANNCIVQLYPKTRQIRIFMC